MLISNRFSHALACIAVALVVVGGLALPQQLLLADSGPTAPITNCTAASCNNDTGCTSSCAGQKCDANDSSKVCTTTNSDDVPLAVEGGEQLLMETPYPTFLFSASCPSLGSSKYALSIQSSL